MPDTTFATLYKQAQELQQKGLYNEFSKLIQKARNAKLPEDEISMIGALFEGAIQFPKTNGPD